MKYLSVILSLSICITAFIGDYMVFTRFPNSQVLRAFLDTSVHGFIGFLSAILFFNQSLNISLQAILYNTMFCTVVSSLIDVDHFIVARSFHIKDLTNLKQRGIFHCTTFWLILTLFLTVYSHVYKKINIYIATYMLILAFTSHHIRDGNRRGIWLYPYGHTEPIPRFVYIFMISVIPIILAYIFSYTKPVFKHTVVYTSLV